MIRYRNALYRERVARIHAIQNGVVLYSRDDIEPYRSGNYTHPHRFALPLAKFNERYSEAV